MKIKAHEIATQKKKLKVKWSIESAQDILSMHGINILNSHIFFDMLEKLTEEATVLLKHFFGHLDEFKLKKGKGYCEFSVETIEGNLVAYPSLNHIVISSFEIGMDKPLAVFDINKPDSFEQIENWIKSINDPSDLNKLRAGT